MMVIVADEIARQAAEAKQKDGEPLRQQKANADYIGTTAVEQWPKAPGDEAYYGLAGDIVRALEPATEADPAALLVQLLVGYGSIIGRNRFFTAESVRHFPVEFAVLVGETSKGRKGSSWGRARRILAEPDESWATNCQASGLSSGEGLIWHVRDPITKRERVPQGRGQPPTYEEIEADPGVDDKRLLVMEPEYASVLHQGDRTGNTLSAILRQAWDCGDLRSLTKNSSAKATSPHISVVGHITIDEVRRYLIATEQANGFGNRHLWVCVRRSKQLPDGGSEDAAAMLTCRARLADAVDFGKLPGEIVRDDDARELWRNIYGDLSDGRPGLTGAMLGRSEAHVMRLAMLYALLDCSPIINPAHLTAALVLWDYCERSVRYIFGDRTGDPLADDLLLMFKANPHGMTKTDINGYLGRNMPASKIGAALGVLLRAKLAHPTLEDTGGRPAERWYPGPAQT